MTRSLWCFSVSNREPQWCGLHYGCFLSSYSRSHPCASSLSPRSLAASVFPWFPVHVCWQKLLVLVLCPVLCNGELVGLGPIYSPQQSEAWAAVHPDRSAFSSSAGARYGTCLWKHYIIDSFCFEALQSSRPLILLSILQIVKFDWMVSRQPQSLRWLRRFRFFCSRPHLWGKVESPKQTIFFSHLMYRVFSKMKIM